VRRKPPSNGTLSLSNSCAIKERANRIKIKVIELMNELNFIVCPFDGKEDGIGYAKKRLALWALLYEQHEDRWIRKHIDEQQG